MHKNAKAMVRVADRYAAELSAQIGTLKEFTRQSGEIGRAHEAYFRGILGRFVPRRYSVGSGFIALNQGTTHQVDIVVHDSLDYSPLFEVGDCVVVEREAAKAAMEVKTSLKKKADFRDAFGKLGGLAGLPFTALIAWESVTFGTAKKAMWDYVREDPVKNFGYVPFAVFSPSKFLLYMHGDGNRETHPFWLFEGTSPGERLLGLVALMRTYGVKSHGAIWPFWVGAIHSLMATNRVAVPWPRDIKKALSDSLVPESDD